MGKNCKIEENNSRPCKKTNCRKNTEKKLDPCTRIIATVNIGFGNTLFIRGDGCGLSWDKGLPMICTQKTWEWACNCGQKENFSYKLLINDEIWCQGDNFTANALCDNKITPLF